MPSTVFLMWVYEGVIDDPYGEFFLSETNPAEAKIQPKDGIPSFLTNVAATILTTGKYLNVMRECGHKVQYNLIGKLRSLKRYLLLDQSLVDIALRSTAAVSDPSHEDLTCCVERSPLLKKLSTLKDLDCAYPPDKLAAADVDQPMPLSVTGLETFCLGYKGFRSVKIGTPVLRSSILCRNMLKFLNSLLHYLTFEVLEPNWHSMHDRLQTARSIDEVIQIHDFFLQKCLKECLLLLPELLVYATSIQLLIPSIDVANRESTSKSRVPRSRVKRSDNRGQQLNLASENVVMSESILKFEAEFNSELQSLVPTLSNSSQAEPT
ncbi:hypothetical protein GUJ93_ZPchr0004g38523 [Zizania palustris]|uniref:Gamma-tubulin complex component n=1 Tax=Zizania palustris TaxID=103762 RepID=A0A8J5SZ62_ZIZPA|nr:hypothetical protein GUJ93_ZPchr0004g38523 [Zizania palustris]